MITPVRPTTHARRDKNARLREVLAAQRKRDPKRAGIYTGHAPVFPKRVYIPRRTLKETLLSVVPSQVVCLFLNVPPPQTTAQQKRLVMRHGKPQFYHGDKMKAEVESWTWALREYAPKAPMCGPLHLSIDFDYAHTNESRRIGSLVRKPTRPDLDGVCKHLIDTLCAFGFFHDDGQVQQLQLAKWYADKPRIRIVISGVGPVAGEDRRPVI